MIIILNNKVSDNQDIIWILIINGSSLFILNYELPNWLLPKKNNNWFTPIFNTHLV
jgi:hypothetical protein